MGKTSSGVWRSENPSPVLLLQLEFCFRKVNFSSFTISILEALAGLLNMETLGWKSFPALMAGRLAFRERCCWRELRLLVMNVPFV